jgi:hypothetical protein
MPFSVRLEDGVVVGTCSGKLVVEDAKAGAMAVWDNRATEVHVFREYEPALSWVRPLVEGS